MHVCLCTHTLCVCLTSLVSLNPLSVKRLQLGLGESLVMHLFWPALYGSVLRRGFGFRSVPAETLSNQKESIEATGGKLAAEPGGCPTKLRRILTPSYSIRNIVHRFYSILRLLRFSIRSRANDIHYHVFHNHKQAKGLIIYCTRP